ncbi:MAG: alpha-amylase, partial [Desertifilum sp. SIO1I2]|nr:alpha-amylase [Desertifilum sp. SIO1I2]
MSHFIEFKLLAPRNASACLIGSFSDWEEIPLEKDDRGYFRTKVELEDGRYQYKFRVQSLEGEWIEVNDPYITEIDDSTGNGILNIKQGQRIVDDYVWQHDDRSLPANENLIIYELLIPDFSKERESDRTGGQYQDILAKLDYLSELGINAIELMPLNEAPGEYAWGYTPSYFFATQPRYGSSKDLKRLIDECHSRGMRVILDQLCNHSAEESPLFQIDREFWYYKDFHHPDAEPSDRWGPEFNYEYYDEALDLRPAWAFMGDVVRFWIEEYHIDGIRFDALKQLDNYDFLYWVTEKSKQIAGDKPFYNIGEYIPETPDLVSPNGPMDGCWHDSFHHCMQAHLVGERFDLEEVKNTLDARRQNYPEGASKVVNYLTNHDRDRLLANLGNHQIFDDAAFRRAKLGAVLLLTASGLPLIWMGEEFGMDTRSTPNEPQNLKWSLLENDRN